MTIHTIETINACEKRISVTVDAKTVEKAILAKVHKKAKNLKRGGFRPNASVTKHHVAKQITTKEKEEIQRQICQDSFSTLSSQEKISYQGRPIIQDIRLNSDGSLSYIGLIETYPEILHVQWQKVQLEKLDSQITEEEVIKIIPLFKKMNAETVPETKEEASQWCRWIIEIFQRQWLRDQVIEVLMKQNQINELPQRMVEARYQEIKRENQESSVDDPMLKEKARQYITADILFKAYALEHQITIDRETLAKKTTQAAQNPFIMSHVKNEALLPYYLVPRIFEDAVIDHLTENANCTTKMISLQDFILLAFKIPESEITKWQETLEKPDIPSDNVLSSVDSKPMEENTE